MIIYENAEFIPQFLKTVEKSKRKYGCAVSVYFAKENEIDITLTKWNNPYYSVGKRIRTDYPEELIGKQVGNFFPSSIKLEYVDVGETPTLIGENDCFYRPNWRNIQECLGTEFIENISFPEIDPKHDLFIFIKYGEMFFTQIENDYEQLVSAKLLFSVPCNYKNGDEENPFFVEFGGKEIKLFQKTLKNMGENPNALFSIKQKGDKYKMAVSGTSLLMCKETSSVKVSHVINMIKL